MLVVDRDRRAARWRRVFIRIELELELGGGVASSRPHPRTQVEDLWNICYIFECCPA
jgi:hypothetical protein